MDGEETKCLLNGEGSVRSLTDANAQVANSYDYDSFGRRLSAVEAVPQPYGWKAREFIPGPDIYYNRARFYDPVLGRFISEDPLGYEGGDTNLYAFTWNNPRNWSDPSGLSAAGEYGGMAGASISRLANGIVIKGAISSGQQAAILQQIRNLASLSRIAVRMSCNLFKLSSALELSSAPAEDGECGVRMAQPKGGVYGLEDENKVIDYVGRTKNFKNRGGDHQRDQEKQHLKMKILYYTEDRATQRGLEQLAHDNYKPKLNKINPIDPKNKNYKYYIDAGKKFLR